MSWADSRLEDEVRMYEAHTPLPDGTERVRYAYGPPWIAMALYMDDIAFDTPEEAKRFWENEEGKWLNTSNARRLCPPKINP